MSGGKALKKIINAPTDFVDEVLEGLVLAHPGWVRRVGPGGRGLVRADGPRPGRVAIVTGGGSGHLPLFLGYVGPGLASGVAVGNVFSSPSTEQVLAATRGVDGGAGVLYLYGNYGGDIYNFDLAAELAQAEGIRVETVLGTDDVMSAPPERASTRRGVAGLFFAYKTAGAAAELGHDLDEVARVARKAVGRTLTMGVGLSPTILPAAGEATFQLGDGEMEIGIGIHGEPGTYRGPIASADEITDLFLEQILGQLPAQCGDNVAVLVNGLGATPLEELYLIFRRTHQVLEERGITVLRSFVGEYATSLEMAGASLSMLALDDELTTLLAEPAYSPFFTSGGGEQAALVDAHDDESNADGQPARPVRRVIGPVSPLRLALIDAGTGLAVHADELRLLDAAVGDGDLGITISAGGSAVAEATEALPPDAHPAEILRSAGAAFASANPSTFAALFGTGLLAAARAADEVETLDRAAVVRLGHSAIEAVMQRGGARVGDKTFIDVLDAAVRAVAAAPDASSAADRAVEAARQAVTVGRDRVAVKGRAAWLGERSIGHADPGSVAALRMIEELRRALARARHN